MQIFLHRSFEKKFARLDAKVKRRFKDRRNVFIAEPFHPLLNNHPLTGSRRGQWSINITGDWRALYTWEDPDTVLFLDIDTHSNLYG